MTKQIIVTDSTSDLSHEKVSKTTYIHVVPFKQRLTENHLIK